MAERPVECSHCKKPAKVIYKEIVNHMITSVEMCADCPLLEQRLHGSLYASSPAGGEKGEAETGLYCGNCRTSLESVRTGNPLGCSECYVVFADVIATSLLTAEQIPSRLCKAISQRKSSVIHVGKSPNKPFSVETPSRLVALNQALNEAVKRENYELAASLRDQIKELTERSHGPKE